MKKTLAVLLSLVMLLALIPAAFAEGEPDFTLVIKGGDVAENLELVGGKQLLAVDVALNGTVAAPLFGLTFDGEETGEEAYQTILGVLTKEVIDRIKAGA